MTTAARKQPAMTLAMTLGDERGRVAGPGCQAGSCAQVTVLDAACLVALFRGEPGAAAVAGLIRRGATISVVNRAEVIDRLARQGANATEVRADLDMLGLDHLDVTASIADRAAMLRATHYHRTTCPVSLADCIAAASTLVKGAGLATSDAALAAMARRCGIDVAAIPNSQGIVPQD
jgi:predicted nucleic acid-binding protein